MVFHKVHHYIMYVLVLERTYFIWSTVHTVLLVLHLVLGFLSLIGLHTDCTDKYRKKYTGNYSFYEEMSLLGNAGSEEKLCEKNSLVDTSSRANIVNSFYVGRPIPSTIGYYSDVNYNSHRVV